MSLSAVMRTSPWQSVPRASGDEPGGTVSSHSLAECSPRERG